MELIERLNWRYATKKFNPEREISDEDFNTLKEAVRLAASSYGLQLYKVLVIEDVELRKKLTPASWNQTQIEDASKLFVFCNYTSVERDDIQGIASKKEVANKMAKDSMKGYVDFIEGKLNEKSGAEIEAWTAKQTYLALGNLLNACAELKIDACPIEGFEPEQYNEILGLKDKGLNAAVVAAVGYRSEEDGTQHAPKVRKDEEELFEVR